MDWFLIRPIYRNPNPKITSQPFPESWNSQFQCSLRRPQSRELTQSSKCDGVSAWLAFFSISSRSRPCGRSEAFSRTSLASEANRSSRGNDRLKRRRLNMARFFPLRKAGAQPGVLIKDKSHDPGCDDQSVRPENPRRESFINIAVGTN
jgi:hypothetical protein